MVNFGTRSRHDELTGRWWVHNRFEFSNLSDSWIISTCVCRWLATIEFGFCQTHSNLFNMKQLDPSQRIVTCNFDTAACKTVVSINNPTARGYLVHKISEVYTFDNFFYLISSCIASFHKIYKEAMHLSHCSGTRDRNRSSLQDRVLPLSVQIQAPANSQFESTLASFHVSSQQRCGTCNSTWRDCCVFLHNSRGMFFHQSTRNTTTDSIT